MSEFNIEPLLKGVEDVSFAKLVLSEVEALRAEKWTIPVFVTPSGETVFFAPTRIKVPFMALSDLRNISDCLLHENTPLDIRSLTSPLWRKYVMDLVSSHLLVPVSDYTFKADNNLEFFRSDCPNPGSLYLAFMASLKTQAILKVTPHNCKLVLSPADASPQAIEKARIAREVYFAAKKKSPQKVEQGTVNGQ